MTPELKREGDLRELTRFIQDLRKKAGFKSSDQIELVIETEALGKKLISESDAILRKSVNARRISLSANAGEEIIVSELKFKIMIEKI